MRFLSRLKGWLPIRTLDLYLGRQLLVYTLIAVGLLSVVMVLGQMFKTLLDLLAKDMISFRDLPQLMWNMFAFSLSYTVPWGLLASVLLIFGRLSADNELTSMRMAGISLFRICLPVFLTAAALSYVCFLVNTKVAPAAYKSIKVQRYAVALDDPVSLFQPQQTIDFIPGYLMYCESKEGSHLKNFFAVVLNDLEPPEATNIIMAKDVEVIPVKEEKRIDLLLTDMTALTHEFVAYKNELGVLVPRLEVKAPATTRQSSLPVDLAELWKRANRPRVEGMSTAELRRVYADTNPEIRSGAAETLQLDYLAGLSEKELRRLRSEAVTTYNSRYSFSLACIALTLVGICFGITAQRRETFVGFALSLAIGIAYFTLILLGNLWTDKPEYRPQYLVWLPNAIFGGLGLFLFWRQQRR